VTFWQVAADLALAAAVPPGPGHTYGMLQGAASWASNPLAVTGGHRLSACTVAPTRAAVSRSQR
jgi:uncharacterized membrane protein